MMVSQSAFWLTVLIASAVITLAIVIFLQLVAAIVSAGLASTLILVLIVLAMIRTPLRPT